MNTGICPKHGEVEDLGNGNCPICFNHLHVSKTKLAVDFIMSCVNKSSDAIYEAFEDLPDEVRDCIYLMADPESPEPCRSALNLFGKVTNIQSLIDY